MCMIVICHENRAEKIIAKRCFSFHIPFRLRINRQIAFYTLSERMQPFDCVIMNLCLEVPLPDTFIIRVKLIHIVMYIYLSDLSSIRGT